MNPKVKRVHPFHYLKPTISNFGLDSDFEFNWQICAIVKSNFFHLSRQRWSPYSYFYLVENAAACLLNEVGKDRLLSFWPPSMRTLEFILRSFHLFLNL